MFWKRKKEEPFERPLPPARVSLAAVAFVRNDVGKPRPRGWEQVESVIEFLPEHAARLRGIEAFSHVLVVFYMDLAADAPEKPEQLPIGGKPAGIFATRSQLRPNHLGVSAVALLGVEGTKLRVRGLDAINGTPVLDVKPYLPEYDSHAEATIPRG